MEDIIIKLYNGEKINIPNLSSYTYDLVPLFDIKTDNIYLIKKENVEERIFLDNYRFPDSNIYNYLKDKSSKYINFLDNFDLEELRRNNLPNSNKYYEITTCIRPSYSNLFPLKHIYQRTYTH